MLANLLHTGALSAAFLASFTFYLQAGAEPVHQYVLNNPSVLSSVPPPEAGLESWLHSQRIFAVNQMLANIGPDGENAKGTAPGCILASPNRHEPNYYFQWIRDGGIVISSLVEQWKKGKWSKDEEERILNKLLQVFMDYIDIQKNLQWTNNPSGNFYEGGLGEPKFNSDGSGFFEYAPHSFLTLWRAQ